MVSALLTLPCPRISLTSLAFETSELFRAPVLLLFAGGELREVHAAPRPGLRLGRWGDFVDLDAFFPDGHVFSVAHK